MMRYSDERATCCKFLQAYGIMLNISVKLTRHGFVSTEGLYRPHNNTCQHGATVSLFKLLFKVQSLVEARLLVKS